MPGWRAVADPLANFIDAAPPTAEGQRRQKLRQQGLQRLLTRMRKRASGSVRACLDASFDGSITFTDCPLGHHRGHGLGAPSLGVHRPVRLAGGVHAGQQPASWFQCCRSGLFGVVVATIAAEATARFLWLAMAHQHGESWLGPSHHRIGRSLHQWEQHADAHENASLRLKFERKGPSDGRGRRRRVVQSETWMTNH